ncbi:hypothetical protein [Burkholderia cenocepacia]|uniref:hypothetical protein n=1 Tax=Burkholderia cenocepacia TaxID=95486 RepID=UPI00076C432D|nr:hypothetical protein [Burkholderia cenocepacia]KWU26404.1 hypothetical protein AS149_25795 [Burkholderia cenocepacia]
MKIEAWKCESTGRVFEREEEFDEHTRRLQQTQLKDERRRELQERLRLLRAEPFVQADSVGNLFDRLLDVYPQVVDILVELGEMSPRHRLVDIRRPEPVGVTRIDSVLVRHLGLPEETFGVNGNVVFVYEGDCFDAVRNEAFKAFPALCCGHPEVTQTLGVGQAPEVSNGQCVQTCYVSVVLDEIPKLKELFRTFTSFEHSKLPALQAQEAEIFQTLLSKDQDYWNADAEIERLNVKSATIAGLRVGQLRLKDAARSRVKSLARGELKELAQYDRWAYALGR